MQLPLVVVADNIRSGYNIGALFRVGDGAGIERLILTGITPHPKIKADKRPTYIVEGAERAIAKTALGAERSLPFEYRERTLDALMELKRQGRTIYGLEISPKAKSLFAVRPAFPAALVLGQELGGLNEEVLKHCDEIWQIPMFGQKESLNVASAAAAALFWLRGQFEAEQNN